jgi:hypothetical protein
VLAANTRLFQNLFRQWLGGLDIRVCENRKKLINIIDAIIYFGKKNVLP